MQITSIALTDAGLRRESNEDSFVARPNLGFWLVCDGMGGHAAGEVASHVAVESIEAFIQDTDGAEAKSFTWPFGLDPELGVDGTRLVTAFRLANRAIEVRVQDDHTLTGMATTAVALLLGSPDATNPNPGSRSALVAHVGDSRAYLWRGGALSRLTRDHSWIEEQVAAGLLEEAEARHHPWRNLVTRALSGGADPRTDVTPLALGPGDRVLLCSDGLCTAVPDALIAEVIATSPLGDVEGLCQTLIDAANAAGGPDNITVVVVDIQ